MSRVIRGVVSCDSFSVTQLFYVNDIVIYNKEYKFEDLKTRMISHHCTQEKNESITFPGSRFISITWSVRKSKPIEPGGGSVCSLCESTFKSNVKMITNARFLSSYSKDEIEKHEK